MSIYQISSAPHGYRVYAYIGFPNDADMSKGALDGALRAIDSCFGRSRLVASSWPRSPHHASNRPHPLLVYCRGGIGKVGKVRLEWMDDFMRRGFVVLAPCYRAAEGGQGLDEFGGAENEDVHFFLDAVSQLDVVDPHDVTVVGFSRGAINATQLCLQSPVPTRLILWGGVSDLSAVYEERPTLRRMLRRITGGTPTEAPAEYDARSPWQLAHHLQVPVLLVHGTDDVQVDVCHAYRMQAELIRRHIPFTSHIYHGLGHHMSRLVHQAVIDRMVDWIH